MRRRRSTSEFFLCFSSRSSSSTSMKISSKSILSPGRTREPTLSVSSSLSRRLSRRSNGSMKGGGQAGQASPMFATGSVKKKGQGGSFEPAEPSSPKVTCIGQVRVKSKKKHGRNKLRNGSRRRNGDLSFRKTEQNQGQQECLPHRNQRWVHLPLSICETLRAFGAEFNCFVPCGGRSSSSCSWSSDREKVDKRRGTGCGAVFARWLFALQESEDKGKNIGHEHEHEHETVVRDQEDELIINRGNRGNREVVSEIEMEILEEKMISKMESFEEEEEGELEMEEARNSICIPPKNALLLMRSRSAPFRMSSLANRFWDSPSAQDKDVEGDLDLEDDEEEEEKEVEDGLKTHNTITEEKQEADIQVEIIEDERECGEEEHKDEDFTELENTLKEEEEMQEPQIRETGQEELLVNGSTLPDAFEVLDKEEETKLQVEVVKGVVEKKEERRVSFSSSTMYFGPESETDSDSDSEVENGEEEEIEAALEERVAKSTEEESVSEEEKEVLSGSTTEEVQDQQLNVEEDHDQEEEEEEKSLLPECLLLMMCEPKLSMEVSKETWVCSRDFIRSRHSEKKNVQKKDGDESTKKRLSTDSNPMQPPQQSRQPPQKQQLKQALVQIQPPRSSCSKVEPLVAKAIERKIANAGSYEPFVLKRCKSEPMRNSAKLAPEVCFWQKNKLETHQPPTLGVGATGIGF